MNIHTIRCALNEVLNEHFTVTSMESYNVHASQIRHREVRKKDIFGFDIVINSIMRLHVFAVVREGSVFFTRPKEGIREFIIPELRDHDFVYMIGDHFNTPQDIVARVIDTWLNNLASKHITGLLEFWCKESFNGYQYTLGYKVTFHHRHELTYDVLFEVCVMKRGRRETYRGLITQGDLVYVKNQNESIVSMEDIFGD